MDFKSGWCDFCENEPGGPKCVAACPTHALSCPDPSQAIIGKAEINRDWCLAAKGITAGATDRAIVVRPTEEVEA